MKHRFDGHPRCDHAEERDFRGATDAPGWEDLDAPALVVIATNCTLLLEVGQVLMDGGKGLQRKVVRNFLHARGVPASPDVVFQVIQYFALAFGERHDLPRRDTIT
jgi:hypothetical protein